MFPVSIPPNAYGSTWCRTTCQRVAPTAYAASRIDGGTARSDSCAATTMIGITSSAIVNAPASTDRSNSSARTNNCKPSSP